MFSLATFALKKWKEILVGLILLFGFFFMFFFAGGGSYQGGINGTADVNEKVKSYEPLITEYAQKYGVEAYVQLLMAKMMQESGGRGGDPMQASESLGLPPNTIQDPERSIDVGVKEFSEVMALANGKVKLALQSYNFGPAFIDYALERGGYSMKVAKSFSNMMAARLGWDSYGDVNYVGNVLRYLNEGKKISNPIGDGTWVMPINTKITSHYGWRTHPLTGLQDFHGAHDFSCNQSNPPIAAGSDGIVSRADYSSGWGNLITINHGGGVVSYYAHLNTIGVKVGQFVEAGQNIGLCGTTGPSTGEHLHFEIRVDGRKTDPAEFGYP